MSRTDTTSSSRAYPLRWVQFVVADWSRSLLGLSLAERGLLLTIAALQADRGGPLPLDDARLARICHTPPGRLAKAMSALIGAGLVVRSDEGLCVTMMQSAIEHAHTLSANAAAAANERHRKTQGNQSDTPAPAKQTQSGCTAREKRESDQDQDEKKTLRRERKKAPLAERHHSSAPEHAVTDLATLAEDRAEQVAIAAQAYDHAAERHGWPMVQTLTV